MEILISLLPPMFILVILSYLLTKDNSSRITVIQTFILGLFVVLPIAVLEYRAMPRGLPSSNIGIILSNLLIVAPAEEMGKLFLVYYTLKLFKKNNKPATIIMISVAGAMGFASLENIIYVLDGGINTGLLRAFSSVPMHACTAIVIGYFGAYEQLERDHYGWIKGFIVAIFMHGLYNVYAMFFNNSSLFSGVFVITFIYVLFAMRISLYCRKWETKLEDIKLKLSKEINNKIEECEI